MTYKDKETIAMILGTDINNASGNYPQNTYKKNNSYMHGELADCVEKGYVDCKIIRKPVISVVYDYYVTKYGKTEFYRVNNL